MHKDSRILAIVVNWNKRDYLQNLLGSLRALGGTPFDIVVVDNASTDGSPEMVRTEFPECSLVETGANLGGTGGFNTGMWWGLKHEKNYDYFWLLDNDVVVHDGALDALLETMESDERIGIVGSAILSLDNPEHVQEIGARFDWATASPIKNGEGRLQDIPAKQLYEADYAAACSLLARVKAIREVGTWDPAYFVQMDDIEWGIRFRRAGWKVIGCGDSRIRHESFDNRRAQQSAVISYLIHRNSLYLSWKLAPPEMKVRTLQYRFRFALALADNHELAGRHYEAIALREAVKDFLRGQMGKPRPELFKLKPDAADAVTSDEFREPPRRIGVVVYDNTEKTYAQLEAIGKLYPGASVQTLLFDPKNQLLQDEKLVNKRSFSSRTLGERLGIARALAADYDAIVVPGYVSGFFFFEFARHRIRLDDAMKPQVEKRRWGRIVGYFPKRLLTWTRSAIYARRVARRPPPEVNYHPFKQSAN